MKSDENQQFKEVVIFKKILHFREKFKISYEEIEEVEIVFLKIIDKDGCYGLGSAAPDVEVTGETSDSILKILRNKLNSSFFTYPFSCWQKYHQKTQRDFAGFPSAQSTVEEAILNLYASHSKIRLENLFGSFRKEANLIITIGIKDKKQTIDEVKKRLRQGFKMIKLKCGLNLKEDIEKIRMIKELLSEGHCLSLDANQGYSLEQAKELMQTIYDSGIKFIEQPIKADDISGLKELTGLNLVPIIADESVVSLADAEHLLKGGYVDGVNIKLLKCGGPLNFLKIFRLAKEMKKIVMIGCMYESNISITTAAALALALPIDYVDLDSGHLDFIDDPSEGGARVHKGKISLGGYLKLKANYEKDC